MDQLFFRLFLSVLMFSAGICFCKAFQVIMEAYRCRKAVPKLTAEDREELAKFSEYLKELGTDDSAESQDRAYLKVYGEKL